MASETLKTVLVTGATGQQGGAVARQLIARSHKVRALVRDTGSAGAIALAKAGVELVQGDLSEASSVSAAAAGVDAVFGVTTPMSAGVDGEIRHGVAIAEAAAKNGAHLVFASAAWAWANTGVPFFDSKWEIEEFIRKLPVRHTIIGPASFMENLTAAWLVAPMRSGGTIPVPLTATLAQPLIAVSNIADLAVLAIEQPDRMSGVRVDIAGDHATGPEIADALSQASGAALQYVEVPKQAVPDEGMRRMFDWCESYQPRIDVDRLRSEYPDISWLGLREWSALQDWPALFFQAAGA